MPGLHDDAYHNYLKITLLILFHLKDFMLQIVLVLKQVLHRAH